MLEKRKKGEKRKMMKAKNQKGITLIALVVTIIILIILAGVSIAMVLGENGLIEKAKEAKEQTEQAKIDEETSMNEVVDYIDNVNPKPVPYDNPYIPAGFKYTGEGTWNSGYTIIGETVSTGNEFVWVPCVLNQKQVKEGDTVVTFGKTLPSTTETTDPYYKYNSYNLGLLPADTTLVAEDSTVAEIETSVGKYGGFYIAKYEAGLPGTTESTTTKDPIKSDFMQKPVSKAGVGVWNCISRINALTVSKNMVNTADGVKSTLISGAAWDTTLQWMVTSSDNKSTNAGYDIDSTGKGWYKNVAQSNLHTTGYYSVNNIYDMAGNVYEWTSENCSGYALNPAVMRGGYYLVSGSDSPSAHRGDNAESESYSYHGFRSVLYK